MKQILNIKKQGLLYSGNATVFLFRDKSAIGIEKDLSFPISKVVYDERQDEDDLFRFRKRETET